MLDETRQSLVYSPYVGKPFDPISRQETSLPLRSTHRAGVFETATARETDRGGADQEFVRGLSSNGVRLLIEEEEMKFASFAVVLVLALSADERQRLRGVFRT